mmetsp:Transcript_687/g.2246  ORF Transcript_687/g.2246 Transcript_687/m.2246 type:complete len:213 (-) Transcript_687:398-1036(-)
MSVSLRSNWECGPTGNNALSIDRAPWAPWTKIAAAPQSLNSLPTTSPGALAAGRPRKEAAAEADSSSSKGGATRDLDLMYPMAHASHRGSTTSSASNTSRNPASMPVWYSASSSTTRKHSPGAASAATRSSTLCQVSQSPTAPGVSTRPSTKAGWWSAWARPSSVSRRSGTLPRSSSRPSTAATRSARPSRPAAASCWRCAAARSGRRSRFR